MNNLPLNGIMPPVTTPFDAEGRVDFDALAQNIARYNETGLAGYVALGSNGEAVHLSQDERLGVIRAIKQAASPGLAVVAGVNELSTRAAITSTRAAADAGADFVLLITPYFYKSSMTGEALRRHFRQVADQSPVPVLIYNVPQNTGVVIESAVIAELAAHENIVGVKDSSGNFGAIAETIRRAPDAFAVLTGNGGILYPSLLMGARGAILGVACAAPRVCVDIYTAAARGDHARARDLQTRLAPVSHIVTAGLGVPGLKAAMGMIGFKGGEPRAPLMTVSAAEREKIESVLRESGLFPELE
ncbi:MAG TPA: dihydrodipicolinate synthase family protein [Blastocatellia bacterium]|nr:dihydrodipicolinate synthase family protein [Blastocatellia bacterium]